MHRGSVATHSQGAVQAIPFGDKAIQQAPGRGRGTDRVYFDGCTEAGVNSISAHLTAGKKAEGLQALLALIEGEKTFVDLPASQLWQREERQIIAVTGASNHLTTDS